jgi:MFS family permease
MGARRPDGNGGQRFAGGNSGNSQSGQHPAMRAEAEDTGPANGASDTPGGQAPGAIGHAPSPRSQPSPSGPPLNGQAQSGPSLIGQTPNGRLLNGHQNGHQLPGHPGQDAGPLPDGNRAASGSQPAAEPEPAGRHRAAGERTASYREVFAVREFRALWLAQLLSYAGDQFAQVAIAILVYERTGSPFLTALAYALTYLPPILGGPLLSGLADLFPRRRVMIALDLIRAALVAGMVVPSLPFGGLCALLFFTVLLGPPFSAARSALLPDVLRPGQFVLASSIGNITFQASQITGFLAGAAMVAALGPHRALAVDALSFCLSAVIVAGWVKARPAPADWPAPRPSLWSLTLDGAAFVFGRPVLRTLVLLGWLAGFAVVPEGLAVPYAHALGGGPLTVGLLMAAMPVGMIIGAFLIGRLTRPATRIRLIGWLAMLSCAPLMVSLAHPPLWALLALWALAGGGGAYQLAAAAAFVHALPAATRGRAFGIAQSGLLASQGLGILAAGAAAQRIGPETVVAIAGLLGMTAAAILASAWTCQHTELLPQEAGGAAAGPRAAQPGPDEPAAPEAGAARPADGRFPSHAAPASGGPGPHNPAVPAPRAHAPGSPHDARPPGRSAR